MAATPPHSFKKAVTSSIPGCSKQNPSINTQVSTLFSDQIRDQPFPLGTHKGEPAIYLSAEDEDLLAAPFKFALVRKISWGRPSMAVLRKEILAAGFKGTCFVGLIDSRHILFRFEQEEDFQRMWLKQSWSFQGFSARIFKWSVDFNPEIESSIVPIWINLPTLPLHCFNKRTLYTLASCVGKPLKTDMATVAALQAIRPSVARVYVEVNVQKLIPNRIWINRDNGGIWQDIQVEDKPNYCTKCYKFGHHFNSYKDQSHDDEATTQACFQKQVWMEKKRNETITETKTGPVGKIPDSLPIHNVTPTIYKLQETTINQSSTDILHSNKDKQVIQQAQIANDSPKAQKDQPSSSNHQQSTIPQSSPITNERGNSTAILKSKQNSYTNSKSNQETEIIPQQDTSNTQFISISCNEKSHSHNCLCITHSLSNTDTQAITEADSVHDEVAKAQMLQIEQPVLVMQNEMDDTADPQSPSKQKGIRAKFDSTRTLRDKTKKPVNYAEKSDDDE